MTLIYSRYKEERKHHLNTVLEILRTKQLYAKLKKNEFWLEQVEFLGHIISKDGVFADSTKIKAIKNWPQPTSIIEFWSFLDLVGDYRRFIEGFCKITLDLVNQIEYQS